MIQERILVIVIGDCPFDHKPFTDRRLIVESKTVEEALTFLGFAKAIIVSEPPGKLQHVKQCFETLFPFAEEHGLVIRILIYNEEQGTQIIEGLRKDKMQRDEQCHTVDVTLHTPEGLNDVAEHIARSYAGPSVTGFQFKCFEGENIAREKKTLFHRAFADAEDLIITKLTGGFAAEGVYRVHAFLKGDGGEAMGEPQPFFVKFARPDAIEKERTHYQLTISPYVPFDLRPNLEKRRCVRGSKLSAIVGNMVEGVVPLRKALKDQLGSGIINNLFEKTLGGLRVRAFNQAPRECGLETYIGERIRVAEFENCLNIIQIAMEFVRDIDPAAITKALLTLSWGVEYRECMIHDDLHDGNVFARGSDAVVIDFERIRPGPLTADPACLEVSLLFKTEESEESDFESWKEFINLCYECIPRSPDPVITPSKHFLWRRSAVRALRQVLFGSNASEKEALLVLAAHLVRFARLPPEIPECEEFLHALCVKRHAYALVVASKIAAKLQHHKSPGSND